MKFKLHLKIRTSLIILFTILFWSLSIILIVYIPARIDETFLPFQIERAKNIILSISSSIEPIVESKDRTILKQEITQLQERFSVQHVMVTDSSGLSLLEDPVTFNRDAFRESLKTQSFIISPDGLILRVQNPLSLRGITIGYLVLEFPLSEYRQEIQGIRTSIVVACFGLYIVAIFVISGIAFLITRPFRDMEAISQQIGEKTSESRRGTSPGTLVKPSSTNEIIDAMEYARVTLDNINNQLERRIEVRTRQLVSEIENRRKIEDQLHKLSVRLQSIREEERAWIAREIHDELGQALTGLKMYITGIIFALKESTEPSLAERLTEKLQSMASLVDTTIGSIQKIVAELRPPILDKVGLIAGIEWYIGQFIERTNIHCEFNSALADKDIPGEYATPLFRIVQETMTNVARHANASEIKINLNCLNSVLSLEIQDNGKGISVEEINSMNSLGLLGMKERIAPLNGEVLVSGVSGKGTSVTVRVPLTFPAQHHSENEQVLIS
jgi:signal transduction histidine kinase